MKRRELLVFAGAGLAQSALSRLAGASTLVQDPQAPASRAADISLSIGKVKVELAPGIEILTTGYNGSAPGPILRMREGVPVEVQVSNTTDLPELVHWHGLATDPMNDGAMEEGSPMIPPQGQARYHFTPQPSGSRWYHTHTMAGSDLSRATYSGQFGCLYIEPKSEPGNYDHEVFLTVHHWGPSLMQMSGANNGCEVEYKYASFNGRMLSASEPLRVSKGQRVLFRLVNASATKNVSLSLPGHEFLVKALDGNPVPNPQHVEVLFLAVAERVDALVEMNTPGVWVLGSIDDAERKSGLGLTVEYADSKGPALYKQPAKNDWAYTVFAMPGLAAAAPDHRFPMVFEKVSGSPGKFDTWTINGKSFPEIDPLEVKEGKRYRMSFLNTSSEAHPMHLHRHSFELVSVGGKPAAGIMKDVVNVDPYSKVEVDFVANNPGPTLFHCHQQLHMDYGFMQMIRYV